MTDTKPMPKRSRVAGFTRARIEYLQNQYTTGNPAARADLARFRRAAGKPLGATPETWQVFSQGFPEELIGRGDAPSKAENAAYHAITLYALHQQSKTDKNMHFASKDEDNRLIASPGLGDAIRQLANPANPDESKAIMRRFTAITTAQTFDALVYHLRGLIKLFRTENIALDYGRLASDLYELQFAESAKSVRLNWARQLYRTHKDS